MHSSQHFIREFLSSNSQRASFPSPIEDWIMLIKRKEGKGCARRMKERIREPDHDFFEVKGDVRRLVFNQSCSSNTNRLVSFMVWITNLLSSPFIQPSVGHFGNLISSHEVLPKCMKGEERKGKDYTRDDFIPTVDWSLKTKLLKD